MQDHHEDATGPEVPWLGEAGARYTLVGELARGGFGRVYSAIDDDLGRSVAIKLPIAPTAASHARFEREARITARLQHSGVVPIYEVGRTPTGQPFFVMKMVEGRSLADLIRQATSEDQRLGLLPSVLSVAETLAYAHEQGVIHRDLKPANVILSHYGETVVIDWGLGRVIGELDDGAEPGDSLLDPDLGRGLTQDGSVLGTPEFMPPEQAHGDTVDERADVYAIGAILFTVLTGDPPYAGVSKTAVLSQVRIGAPLPLSARAPRLPPDLVTIVGKAMERHPRQRYRNASELADDLRRFLAGQLVRAHNYSLGGLSARWLRKHRISVTLVGLLLAASVTAGVLAARRIVVERNAAVAARRTAEASENALALQHAELSLADDPTATLAGLKRHRPSPESAWRARAIAEEAAARGAARHVFPFGHASQAVATAGGLPLLAVGSKSGTIRLHRLDTGGAEDLGGHSTLISDLEFCPAGACLASLDVQGRLKLSRLDGRQIDRVLRPSATARVTFSADGRMLAASSGQAALDLFTSDSLGQRRSFNFLDRLAAFSFCPDTGTLVTLDFAGRASALYKGHDSIRQIPGNHPDASLVCLPDGVHFVSGGVDGAVKVWHARKGVLGTVVQHRDWVSALAASADGTVIASGSGDDTVILHDRRGGSTRTLSGHTDTVRGLAFTRDGRSLLSVSYDGTVKVWQVGSGEVLTSFRTSVRAATRLHLAEAEESFVVSGSEEARVYRLPKLPIRVLRGHDDAIITLDWSPDGRLIAGGGRDSRARVWDAMTGKLRQSVLLDSWATLVRFFSNDALLTSTRTARTAIFHRRTGRLEHLVAPGPATAALTSIVLSPDRHRLAYVSGRRVWLRDIATGATQALADELGDVEDIAFTNDGQQVAVISVGGLLGFWSASDGLPLLRRHVGERPSQLGLSPDGRWMIVRTALHRLLLWDRVADRLSELPNEGLIVSRQAFSKDSRLVAYTLADSGIRLYDLVTRRSRTLRGHRSPITELVLSPDGAMMASGDEAGFTRIWSLSSGESSLLWSSPGPIQRIAFSPDGARLAIAAGDRAVQIWEVTRLIPPGAGTLTWLRDQTSAVIDQEGKPRTPPNQAGFDRL